MNRALWIALALVTAVALTACGDEGNDNANVSNGGNDSTNVSNGGGTQTTSKTTTTTVGGATIVKIFQPGVIQLALDAASALSESELTINSPTTPIELGSVITWNDQAYVVEHIALGENGVIQVSTRPAEFSEVLVDMQVTGDLQTQDIDVEKMNIIASDSPDSLEPQEVLARADTNNIGERISHDIGSCKSSDDLTGLSLSCVVKQYTFSPFRLDLTAGIRNLKTTGVDISFSKQKFEFGDINVTPFIRADVNTIDENNKTQDAEFKLPIFYAQLPIKQTLGLLRVDVPARIELTLPIFQFQIGTEIAFPYSSKDGVKWQIPSLSTSVATTTDNEGLFNYSTDASLYAVIGAELVLAKYSSLQDRLNAALQVGGIFKWFKSKSTTELQQERYYAVGAWFKGGLRGSVSLESTNFNSPKCLKWDYQGAVGYSAEIWQPDGDDDILDSLMIDFGEPIRGSSGCEGAGDFWRGTIDLTTCSLPRMVACTYYAFDNAGSAISNDLMFRTGNDTLNIRNDLSGRCYGATASIPVNPVIGSSWTYTMKSEPPYRVYTATTWNFTVTNVTPDIMEGTMSVKFIGNSITFTDNVTYGDPEVPGSVSGTATGVWYALRMSHSFPKCLPSSPLGFTGEGEDPRFFYDFECFSSFRSEMCDWKDPNDLGRSGEWLNL